MGRKALEKFVVPQGGGQNSHSPKILHHLLNEFTRKYQEKNLCPPPESLRGDILAVPPLNCSGGGQFSGGGQSPP